MNQHDPWGDATPMPPPAGRLECSNNHTTVQWHSKAGMDCWFCDSRGKYANPDTQRAYEGGLIVGSAAPGFPNLYRRAS